MLSSGAGAPLVGQRVDQPEAVLREALDEAPVTPGEVFQVDHIAIGDPS
jgi:hypothetical protein